MIFRIPPNVSYVIARTVDESIALVREKGMPVYISFDHDLGIDDDGNLLSIMASPSSYHKDSTP